MFPVAPLAKVSQMTQSQYAVTQDINLMASEHCDRNWAGETVQAEVRDLGNAILKTTQPYTKTCDDFQSISADYRQIFAVLLLVSSPLILFSYSSRSQAFAFLSTETRSCTKVFKSWLFWPHSLHSACFVKKPLIFRR